jgi:hypothetical protein
MLITRVLEYNFELRVYPILVGLRREQRKNVQECIANDRHRPFQSSNIIASSRAI